MKIVVDTNIVFSGILNTNGTIGKLLTARSQEVEFYSCDFLQTEISRHRPKLLKLTKLSDPDVAELQRLVTANITFINEALLPKKLLQKNEQLLADIDPDDTPFVALAKHLKGKLWTGDMELYNGLKAKRVRNVLTTAELAALLKKLD